jgi:hypothetical protein
MSTDPRKVVTSLDPFGGRASSRTVQGKNDTSESIGAAFVAIAAGGVALLASSRVTSLDGELWMAVVGATAVGIGCLLLVVPLARMEGGPMLIRIGPASILLYTLSFGVFSLGWLTVQSGSRLAIDPAQIPPAVAVSMAGLLALTAGYSVGPPQLIVGVARNLLRRIFPPGGWSLRVPSIAVLLYLAGTASRLVRLRSGQYGYLQDPALALSSPSPVAQLLSLLETLTMTALVVAAIDHWIIRPTAHKRWVLVALAAVECAVALFSASKQGVIFPLVALTVVFLISGRTVKIRLLAVGVVSVSLLFSFNVAYRNTIRDAGTTSIAPSEALSVLPTVVGRTIGEATAGGVVVDGPAALARRLRLVDNVAIVRQKTPEEIEYRSWSDLVTGPMLAAVPRVIWPEKPVISTGRDFAIYYYEVPSSVYSANAVTVPGDLIRHGGILPMVAGMLLLGAVIRLFDTALRPVRDARHLIVYIPVFLHLLKLESGVTIFVVGLAQLLAFLVLTSWLVFVRGDPGRRIASG